MSDAKTFTISELSKEFACTPRALRFYEDTGLIQPMRVGLQRVYQVSDRRRIRMILRLRKCGVGLPEVRWILEARDRKEREKRLLDVLHRRMATVEAERSEISGAITHARAIVIDGDEVAAR